MIRRRQFISLLGATAAWPLAACAQQQAMPVVGFLRSTPAAGFAFIVDALQAGRPATATTPIIFVIGADPVRVGLMASLNRPGGNITGVVFSVVPLVAKLLGMLHELVPKASMIAVLRDPNGPDVENESRDLEEAAGAIGRQILMVNAANEREFQAPSQRLCKRAPAGCSSAAVHSSSANADSSWRSLAGMPCRRCIISASTPRLAA
jgi:putative ABC transport system substrate-binding protein